MKAIRKYVIADFLWTLFLIAGVTYSPALAPDIDRSSLLFNVIAISIAIFIYACPVIIFLLRYAIARKKNTLLDALIASLRTILLTLFSIFLFLSILFLYNSIFFNKESILELFTDGGFYMYIPTIIFGLFYFICASYSDRLHTEKLTKRKRIDLFIFWLLLMLLLYVTLVNPLSLIVGLAIKPF